MFIKVVSDDDAITSMFECDEYNVAWVAEGSQIATREDVLYCYPDNGEFEGRVTLWLYKDGEPKQILLWESTAFVMNDNGKTIDTICA